VDTDLSRQAVVAGILHFAAAAHCQVIAEGIETEAELAMLTELGVALGQGYLLGRPAAAETWSHSGNQVPLPHAAGPMLRVERRAVVREVTRREAHKAG
jgi:EAL domain-containing protein (putative c-di-GMP-specific phosphodiesterase class I)